MSFNFLQMESAGKTKAGMVVCPNSNLHLVYAVQLNQHLLSCRLQDPATGYIICPYNHDHRVPEYYYMTHLERCIDVKKMIQHYLDQIPVVDFNFKQVEEPPKKKEKAVQVELDVPLRNLPQNVQVNPSTRPLPPIPVKDVELFL